MVRSGGLPGATALALAWLALAVALIIAAPHPAYAEEADDRARPGQDLRIEAELQPDALHLNAQARYTLRLYQAVSVRELAFHAPEAARAEIRPAGETIREVTRAGRRYRVTERHYAVFPFASGPLQFTGGYVSLRTDDDSTPMRRIDAPPLTRQVSPVPSGHSPQEWLPARALTLTETWHPDVPQLPPGQALRRTIRIEATGVAAAQIPPLPPGADGFSLHPAPPRLEERTEDGWITGIREQTWLLVPRQGGDFTLPALQLPWWDPVTEQAQQATLPARPITATAPPGAADPAATKPDAPAATLAPPQVSAPATAHDANAHTTTTTLLITMALLAAGALLLHRYRSTATLRRLRRACRNNNPTAARAALQQWSREIGIPGPDSLLALARHLRGAATHAELAALDRHLYGDPRQVWDGRRLIAALRSEQPDLALFRLRLPETTRGKPAPTRKQWWEYQIHAVITHCVSPSIRPRPRTTPAGMSHLP